MLKRIKDLKVRIFGEKSESEGVSADMPVSACGNQSDEYVHISESDACREEAEAAVTQSAAEQASAECTDSTPADFAESAYAERTEESADGSEDGIAEDGIKADDGVVQAEGAEQSDGEAKLKSDADRVRKSIGRRKIPREKYVAEVGKSETVRVNRETSALRKISAIWTLVSTAYAIVTTCLFVSRDWVSSVVSYVLIAILAVYVLVFIGLIVFVVRDPQRGTKSTKAYKKGLGIFKAVINVVFLALTAVSLTGMAANDMNVGKWIMFVLTFVVAVVQLGLKICLLAMKLVTRHIAKKYKVKIENYRDGRRKKNGTMDKLTERKYREKD